MDDGSPPAALAGAGSSASAGAAGSSAVAGTAGGGTAGGGTAGGGAAGASTLPEGCAELCRTVSITCGDNPPGGCNQQCLEQFKLGADYCLAETLELLDCMSEVMATPHLSCSAAQASNACDPQGNAWVACFAAGP